MLGGAMLAVAMSAFVIAIDTLDQAIAYPICAMAPGLVTTLWSILYFREITVRLKRFFEANLRITFSRDFQLHLPHLFEAYFRAAKIYYDWLLLMPLPWLE